MDKIKPKIYVAVMALMAVMMLAAGTLAQDQTFSSPNVDYSFMLPDAKWKLTVMPSDASPNVEYVYGDRLDGHLEVRKIPIRKDTLLTKVVDDEQEKLQFLLGYAAGKKESFSGKLRGMIFNYEFVRAGNAMGGRIYFLRANDTTVYAIRFTGVQNRLKSLEHQTDSIARTFGVKQPG